MSTEEDLQKKEFLRNNLYILWKKKVTIQRKKEAPYEYKNIGRKIVFELKVLHGENHRKSYYARGKALVWKNCFLWFWKNGIEDIKFWLTANGFNIEITIWCERIFLTNRSISEKLWDEFCLQNQENMRKNLK